MTANYSLDALWMPFTANRDFKQSPRLIARTEGVYCYTDSGRPLLDGTAGLWCVNAGHGRAEIADAIARQARELDYSSPFNCGHEIGFRYAERLVRYAPPALNRVFFSNSGSEAVESALKIALAYQAARGKPQKHRLIGRELAYHGVNFGGISVGGLEPNRSGFGPLLAATHLPHTLDLARNAFSRGLPGQGVEQAEALGRMIRQQGADSVAAVIVEPVSGAGGVILPPQGYLQRLREICDQYDVLLIFDEVITGWGRLGAPFAATEFGVVPDMIVTAKGITNGVIPMGAVLVRQDIQQTVFDAAPEGAVELFHGYTYSGHPVACAAAMATLDIYEREGLLNRAGGAIGQYWEQALHDLRDCVGVVDVRNYGLIGALQFDAALNQGHPFALALIKRCFEEGVMVRTMGHTLALSPPLTIEPAQIDELLAGVRRAATGLFGVGWR